MRGLAALGVVFWHWQHFFFQGTSLTGFDPQQQPLFSLFRPLYENGWAAVDFFFCLSGFVFYWLYQERISRRETRLKEFFVLRLSRLYPLHLVTLLIVALEQSLMHWRTGSFFVYPDNDIYHFCLQLFFAADWGFEHGFSFNGPAWSVSVEVLCYACFFLACYVRASRWWHLFLYSLIGFFLIRNGLNFLGRGVFVFFIGGLAYKVFQWLLRRPVSGRLLYCFCFITIAAWLTIPIEAKQHLLLGFYEKSQMYGKFTMLGKDIPGILLLNFSWYSFDLVLFPLTIVTLALVETWRGILGRRLAFIGHLSYSSYLLHFPLQILVVYVAICLGISRSCFQSPWLLFGFFLVLIALSLASYHYFERPCQSWLRARYLSGKRSVQ